MIPVKKMAFFGIVFLLMLGAPAAWAVEKDVDFSIRYYDKKLYYPESDIELKITLQNNTPSVYRFRLSDTRAYSVDFDVRNMAGQPLQAHPKFTIDRNSNQPVYFREVAIEPGEEFSFTINLKEFVKLEQSGVYTIQARFYPGLYNPASTAAPHASNILPLSVRPSAAGLDAVQERVDQATGEILKASPLPPDEVVRYFLSARQAEQWERYFLYLDEESLYKRISNNEAGYRNMSEIERGETIKKFRENLKKQLIDNEVLVIPSDFEIIKTTYTPNEASVEVIQKYNYSGYREVKLFVYNLTKRDTIWIIYNYAAQNRSTESRR